MTFKSLHENGSLGRAAPFQLFSQRWKMVLDNELI